MITNRYPLPHTAEGKTYQIKKQDMTYFAADAAIGTPLNKAMIGEYEVLRLIGEGASCLVYHALDIKSGNIVCLKEIYPISLADRIARKGCALIPCIGADEKELDTRIQQYAMQESVISDAVRYTQGLGGITNDGRFLNVTLVEPGFPTLARYLCVKTQSGIPLSEAQWDITLTGQECILDKLNLTKRITETLQKFHEKGFLHLDLKPENLFISDLNQNQENRLGNHHVFLLDYGSSIPVDSKGHIQTDIPLSITEAYAAPEVLEYVNAVASNDAEGAQNARKLITYAADTYSVVKMLFDLLVDGVEEPVEGYRYDSIRQSADMARIPGNIKQQIVDFISKGMSIFPDQRYQTAQDLLYALDPIIVKFQQRHQLTLEELPHFLTKTGVFEDGDTLINRDQELDEITKMLAKGKTALLLHGFGGVGKTTLARALFSQLSNYYDCVAWIEYNGTLRESFLTAIDAIELYDDVADQEKRWELVSNSIKNLKATKLFMIDNVDQNSIQNQYPQRDKDLQEIAGWADTTVVITSRLPEIIGYRSYLVNSIGNEKNIIPCIDLFYYYYDREEMEKSYSFRTGIDAVKRLVELAGYHTYAIELLARSAAYEDDLNYYVARLQESGFRFPSLRISTKRNQNSSIAAEQLKRLFDMGSRTPREQQILWDFSVLPENITLSRGEVTYLLNYTDNDLDSLCKEGWLRFRKGSGFYIHSLVQETVHIDLLDGKAPSGTAYNLLELVSKGELIQGNDSQAEIAHKITIVENVAKFIDFSTFKNAISFFRNIGMLEYLHLRKRITSIHYLELSLKRFLNEHNGDSRATKEWIANLKYELGYIKSTTHEFRRESEQDLREALSIWESIDGHESDIAKVKDHLGYVLSDNGSAFGEAKSFLESAFKYRERIKTENPSLNNLRDYATTCDNLGCLLAQKNESWEEAERLLQKAYSIRETIWKRTGDYSTDVAWTAFNLGKLLSQKNECAADAEDYFLKSLEIRQDQNEKHPGVYTTNIVFTLVNLAKLLMEDPQRIDDVKQLTAEAISLKGSIDDDHTGFFSNEILDAIEELTAFINNADNEVSCRK